MEVIESLLAKQPQTPSEVKSEIYKRLGTICWLRGHQAGASSNELKQATKYWMLALEADGNDPQLYRALSLVYTFHEKNTDLALRCIEKSFEFHREEVGLACNSVFYIISCLDYFIFVLRNLKAEFNGSFAKQTKSLLEALREPRSYFTLQVLARSSILTMSV